MAQVKINQLLNSLFNSQDNDNNFRRVKRAKLSLLLPGLSIQSIEDMKLLKAHPFIHISLVKVFRFVCDVCSAHENFSTANFYQNLGELDQLLNYLFERLNTGHWKSIDSIWRTIYTFVCLLKVPILLKIDRNTDALTACDMGLLMGQPICDNVLSRIAELICSGCPNPRPIYIRGTAKQFSTEIKNKSTNEFQIEEMKRPSLEKFLEFMKNNVPVKLYGVIEHWPALKKWNVEYIREVAGLRTVPVEIGSKYDSEDWTQKIMTLNEFIDNFIYKDNCEVGYVAQYSLFDQIPTLKSDIISPDYTLLKDAETHPEINAWFGPANTISPTHHDPKDNILVQVFGTKTIRLFPPSESSSLNPYPEGSLLFNTSQLDVESKDLFDNAPGMGKIKHCDVVINDGECLFLPVGWWHYVRSCTESFSVSYWF